MNKTIIVAYSENRVIGKDGSIPWHFPEDLKYFKEKTTGSAVLMGRRTFESLPEGAKPLPERLNIVLTSSPDEISEDVSVASSLEEVWEIAEESEYEELFIAGGASVYSQTIDEVDLMLVTIVKKEFEGDSYFPEFKKDNWSESVIRETDELVFKEFTRV